MMVHMSGTRGGEDWPPYGGVLEVDDEEGAHLCRAGMAVPVVEDTTETAVALPAEVRAEPSDLDALRAQAQALGVKVDGRWQAARLREEIANASGKAPGEGAPQ